MSGVFDTGGFYDSTTPISAITAVASWTEGSESIAATGSVGSVIGASLGWTEGSETISVSGTVGASAPGTATIGWVEGSEAISISGSASVPNASSAAIGWTEGSDLIHVTVTATDGSGMAPIPPDYQFSPAHQRIRLYTGQQGNFTPKRAAEVEIFGVDFAPELAPGETITSAAWSIAPVDGIDPAASAMISGSQQLIGSISAQRIGGGVPGVRYAPICTAQTSFGQTLVLPEYGQGQLEVTL